MTQGPPIGEESTRADDLPAGTVITQSKQYKIVQRLGEGGMGKVYKVFDPIMNRYAALKMMKMDVPEGERRRFRQEARLCGTFGHPNLIRALEVGTTKEHGLFWFAMDYLEGMDLEKIVESRRPLALHVAKEIFSQALEALAHVHRRKIVHCDIKPGNIFVSTDAYDPVLKLVKVLDFGVCRDLSDTGPIDASRVLGDAFYMPPEQTIPGNYLDHRADIYALGMTFFEVMTGGRHPLEDLFQVHPREALRAQRERAMPALSAYLGPDVPPERAQALDAFFAQCVAKDPAHRFQTSEAMQAALMAIP